MVFLDITTGFPGSVHDSCVLLDSTLYRNTEQGRILIMPTETVQGIAMRPILLDGGRYPLKPWLSHHISFQLISLSSKKKFSKSLSSNPVNVEQAFGILKARW